MRSDELSSIGVNRKCRTSPASVRLERLAPAPFAAVTAAMAGVHATGAAWTELAAIAPAKPPPETTTPPWAIKPRSLSTARPMRFLAAGSFIPSAEAASATERPSKKRRTIVFRSFLPKRARASSSTGASFSQGASPGESLSDDCIRASCSRRCRRISPRRKLVEVSRAVR
jgi:hypothetical protein